MRAAKAKSEYAERLTELREAEVEEQKAAVSLASVQLERAKFDKVQQRGMAEGLDGAEFNEAVSDAQAEYDEKRSAADELRDGVHSARASWDEARAAYRRIDDRLADKTFRAPPEPKYLQLNPKATQQQEQQAKQLPPDQTQQQPMQQQPMQQQPMQQQPVQQQPVQP